MNMKSRSSLYLGLWLGLLLLVFVTGCDNSNRFYRYNPYLQVYAANGNALSVFAVPAGSNTNINVAPGATLTGSNTGLDDPHRLTFDSNNNTYITNAAGDSVTIFSPGIHWQCCTCRHHQRHKHWTCRAQRYRA